MNGKYDYVAMATTYASFLGSLGGVCITILTLVLALNPEEAKRKNLHPLLVAALLVATIACFVGAHLMADVVAFKESPHLLRLFRTGSINTYVSISLIAFSLMLLPMVYDKNIPKELKTIGMMTFLLVEFGVFYWMYSAVTSNFVNPPNSISGNTVSLIAGVLCILVATTSYILLRNDADGFPPLPFYFSLFSIIASLVYYNYTRDWLTLPAWTNSADKVLYCVAASLPAAALIGVGFKAYRD